MDALLLFMVICFPVISLALLCQFLLEVVVVPLFVSSMKVNASINSGVGNFLSTAGVRAIRIAQHCRWAIKILNFTYNTQSTLNVFYLTSRKIPSEMAESSLLWQDV